MRKPRDTRSWNEYSLVSALRSKERFVEEIDFTGDVAVALIYPNDYRVASSSLSTHVLLRRFNSLPNVRAERFYYVPELERFYSLDSLTPLDEFRIWAFSVHFELDILNVFDILNSYGIPLKSGDRLPSHPVIVMGGAMTYFNDSLVSRVADVVNRGDLSRNFLERLAALRPSMNREETVSVMTLEPEAPEVFYDDELGQSLFITPESVFKDRFLIEIGRGCKRKCRFCVSGYRFGNARFRDPDELLDIMDRQAHITKRFGLVAATVTDYPFIDRVLERALELGYDLSVSSLRLDALSENLLEVLKKGNQKIFTIAPEGGSQRIRNLFGKGINDRDIDTALEMGIKKGFKNIKLYFIYGAFFEDESDRSGIVDIAKLAVGMGYSQVVLSLNPLVPKPGTPFEELPMENLQSLKKIERELRSKLRMPGVKSDFESLKESSLQYALGNIDEAGSENFLEYLKEERNAIPFLQRYVEELNLRRKEWKMHGKEEYSCY